MSNQKRVNKLKNAIKFSKTFFFLFTKQHQKMHQISSQKALQKFSMSIFTNNQIFAHKTKFYLKLLLKILIIQKQERNFKHFQSIGVVA